MNKVKGIVVFFCTALLFGKQQIGYAQPGSQNFSKVWVQGQSVTFTTTFDGTKAPDNQIISKYNQMWFSGGNSSICDSSGNPLLICDGYNLYGKDLKIIDSGKELVPWRIVYDQGGYNFYSQGSIILPFSNKRYILVTPTVSNDSCYHNWEKQGNGELYDLILYSEIDMNANGGAGKVTRRMVPLLGEARLSKTQMMACRHRDGKSWWVLKQASDTNLVYKFLFTEERVYGPYLQGFGGNAARYLTYDWDGQAMFSADGTKYASANWGYGKVFMADFDRCTGMLSNPRTYKVPDRKTGNPADSGEIDRPVSGLCFSPSGQYLYVSGEYNVQQFDLSNPDTATRWTHLSGPDTAWIDFQRYSNIYPGPDGKLYIGNYTGFSGQMSVINKPDSAGIAAEFCRKCLRFPGFLVNSVFRFAGVSTPPCMPNYSLGPTNPVCYPTGVSVASARQEFELYPNPTQGNLIVRTDDGGTLRLYDITGRIVLSIVLYHTGATPIDVSSLTSGLYHFKFIGRSGQGNSGKLTIRK